MIEERPASLPCGRLGVEGAACKRVHSRLSSALSMALELESPGMSCPPRLGSCLRWVKLLEDLGGLPPSIIEAVGGGPPAGVLDESAVMQALETELAYWEAAARSAVENVEQRFSSQEHLASFMFFR